MNLISRNQSNFKNSIYLIITVCWFDMFLQKCTFAKSNPSQILFNANRVPTKNKIPLLTSNALSEPWEPRKTNLNANAEQFYQYQNILFDEVLPASQKYFKASFLPQLTPIENDDSWQMDGDCKLMQAEDRTNLISTKHPRFSKRAKASNLNDANCGRTPTFEEADRIVGGDETEPFEYPWNVALTLKWGLQFCGGSLINKWYVLTAAHCVAWGRAALKMKLRIGDHNLKGKKEAYPHIERGVTALKMHIKYDASNTDYDVALIKLDKPVDLDLPNVGTVCLPKNETILYTGKEATVTGWGMMSYSGKTSNILRQVNVTVISNKLCNRLYKPNPVTNNMLCAGEIEKGGKDACQGDSGGPLVLKNSDEKWLQIGIVSWGRDCARPEYPGVYARVTTFFDWIRRHSKY